MGLWETFTTALAGAADRPALVCGEARWTWGEAAARVTELAGRLGRAGLRPGERVALLAPNGDDFLIATYAAVARGAVLVPLNTRLAVPELRAILDDAGARALLAHPSLDEAARAAAEGASRAPLRVPLATDGRGVGERELATFLRSAHRAAASDAAQLYYTSGTTGRAKGVVLTHGNLRAHAESAIAELDLTAAERWAHIAPMFHLADAWATVAITRVGGTHVMLPRFDPGLALALLERERITLTNLVPTMLGAMVRHPSAAMRALPGLRLLLSGGAPIAPALVREVETVFGCTYAQTYGLTETSPFLTISLLDERHANLSEEARLACRARTGRPFRGVEVQVVDAAGVPVPVDDATVGEVRARGPTVTPGYWNRPEETAAALRDGWLYTGDLAVVDALGSLRIVDRKKDMIVTGGENVYSTEVEAVLYEHPAVAEAAVFGLSDATWGETVSAAVVLREGSELGLESLLSFCRARIAGYKLPRRVEFLDTLPRTGSGKISKRHLRRRFETPSD